MSKLLRILLIVYHAWLTITGPIGYNGSVGKSKKYIYPMMPVWLTNQIKSIDVYASFVIALPAEPELTHLMTMMEKTLAETPKTTMAMRM